MFPRTSTPHQYHHHHDYNDKTVSLLRLLVLTGLLPWFFVTLYCAGWIYHRDMILIWFPYNNNNNHSWQRHVLLASATVAPPPPRQPTLSLRSGNSQPQQQEQQQRHPTATFIPLDGFSKYHGGELSSSVFTINKDIMGSTKGGGGGGGGGGDVMDLVLDYALASFLIQTAPLALETSSLYRYQISVFSSSSSSSSSSNGSKEGLPCVMFQEMEYCKEAFSNTAISSWFGRYVYRSRTSNHQDHDSMNNVPTHLHISRPGIFSWLQPFESFWSSLSFASSSSSSIRYSPWSTLPFRRNPNLTKMANPYVNSSNNNNNNNEEPSSLSLLLSRPAMVILLGLQLVLAFLYWNNKVTPNAVAKDYVLIQDHGHAWRFLSGATAHFDLWHLALNMSAFYNLSLHLEQRTEAGFSSLEYLAMNLSLVPAVGAAWYLLQRYCLSPEQRGLTVGYSGVLFAWSVISTLRQPPGVQTCPIPFFPNWCFSTRHLLRRQPDIDMAFSWAPFVQLVLAQILLPRVSWTGHLAGVLLGWMYSWGLLPFLAFPSIYWTLLHILFLRYIRGIQCHHHYQPQPQQHHSQLKHQSLLWLQLVTLAASVLLAGGPLHPINISFGLWMVFEYYVQLSDHQESVVRGFAVASVLLIQTLTFTLATRFSIFGFYPVVDLVQGSQWILCAIGLLFHVIPVLADQQQQPTGHGIFEKLLGPILFPTASATYLFPPCFRRLDPSTNRNDNMLPLTATQTTMTTSSALSQASPGSGRTLGASGSRGSGNRVSRLV